MSDDETRDREPEAPGPGPWNARQERVAALLASGSTIRDAAVESGAGERTIHSWLDDPAYRAFVEGLRDRILAETIGRLTRAATRAATVLEGLLEAESEGVRLRAALGLIDTMIKTREHGELSARVTELEAQLSTSGGPGRWQD
jgi:hypothetical protein